MAIQHRRGDFNNFEPEKMVAGEFAYVNSNDPATADGKGVYATFTGGVTKRMCTYDEVSGLVNQAKQYKEDIEETANVSKSYAVGGTGTREGEDYDNAKFYYENAKAVVDVDIATVDKAGLVKPDDSTIKVRPDGTLYVDFITAKGSYDADATNCQINIDLPNGDCSIKTHSTSENLFVTAYSYSSGVLNIEFNKQIEAGQIFVEARII